MLGSAKSEHPRLTNHQIIFEVYPTYVITILQRYRQTDDLPWQFRTQCSIMW